MWEFHGPIEGRDLQPLLHELGGRRGRSLRAALLDDDGAIDPILAPRMVVAFSQGYVLDVHVTPFESEVLPYSVGQLDTTDTGIYSDGIPNMLRDPQKALNAAWRMLMDNGALSAIPMVVLHTGLKAANGVREIAAGKVWIWDPAGKEASTLPPVLTVPVAQTTDTLVRIIEMTRQFFDDESLVPLIAQGAQSAGTQPQATAHEMTLKATAVNIAFRNVVRAYDRQVKRPNMQRLYEYEMEHGPEAVKGDMDVVARGSSVLLVREVASSSRMTLVNMLGQNPMLQAAADAYWLISELFEAMSLDTTKAMVGRELFEERWRYQQQVQAQAAAGTGAQDAQAKMALEELRQQMETMREEMRQATQHAQIAAAREGKELDAQVKLEVERMKAQSSERVAAAEFALKQRGQTGI